MSRKSPEISVPKAQESEARVLRFLPGLNEEHRELQEELKKMQQDILESEWKVNETEAKTGEKNGELIEANTELGEKNNRISEIDTQVGEKQNETEKNTGEIGSIDTKIANLKKKLKGGGDTPETLKAVTGPNNQVSGSKESAADIQQRINALEGQRAKLVARNETLKKEITALKSEREPLVVRRDELQETTIPGLQNEIAQLVELKKSQEEEKNKLVAEKNNTEVKNGTLMAQIEAQEKEIAGVQTSIAEAQTRYAENSERESRERPQEDFFESFVGVWA